MSEDNPTAAELAEYDRLHAERTGTIPFSARRELDRLQNRDGAAVRVSKPPSPASNRMTKMDKYWSAFTKHHGRVPENPKELDDWIAAGGGT